MMAQGHERAWGRGSPITELLGFSTGSSRRKQSTGKELSRRRLRRAGQRQGVG